MAIPQHTIDQILDRTDIVDLIGQRVKLKKTGRTYSGCCPFHQEKTPSFHVYRDKQYYHCFGCQANGNAIRFLMDIDNRNFIDVMKELSSNTGVELPKDNTDNKKLSYTRQVTKPSTPPKTVAEPTTQAPIEDQYNTFEPVYFDDPFAQFEQPFSFDEPVQEGNLYDLLENVAQFYERQLPTSQKAKNYFKQRGLSDQTIQFWRLGYAPEDWQHLEKAFPYDIEGLKQLGLIRSSDSGRDFDLLRDRVIFPIRDPKGRVVGFGGRALNDEIKPKYINSPDSEVFHKNQLLYGLYEGRKLKANDWLMVEGYMDVIALQQYGITGAVATLGTASNTEHLNILFKQNNRITIAFDGDAAGQKAARRTLEIALPLLNDGRELKFFVLPNDHDPDSLIRREGVENFQKLLQQAPLLSDFVFAHLTGQHDISTPEGKSLVMGELRELTELLPKTGSFRYLLTQSFREKLGLGKRFTPQISHDASLSFNIQTKDEDFAIAILIANPFLYTHFEILRAYIDQDTILGDILFLLDQVSENIPEDQEQAIYYVLGACSSYVNEISKVLDNTNIFSMLTSPEKAFNHANEYSLGLQDKYLKQKMRKAKTLQEASNLRQQHNEVTKKISLRLLS
ncbi:DNA primase [Acinetobacter baumannii]|uniref:DNA primase n=9 Tax=Gammaproteobacteria TaxID=1236 RepID=A0AAD2U2C2_ACIBA|nr:DNA primase [Acinetobacter baumannii]EHZ6760964.1 DNA primase [Acinetobacter baumannii]EHZ6833343.1 DNA primase [Acinetobacter baumannii]EHZ7474617.1 DNA primase [Acinetobacter baumannii]EHZ7942298.1 DNA primase [Acinetobacter baumannii]EHZ8845466.1 DNA primase [Acinetobacter baumannii]